VSETYEQSCQDYVKTAEEILEYLPRLTPAQVAHEAAIRLDWELFGEIELERVATIEKFILKAVNYAVRFADKIETPYEEETGTVWPTELGCGG
jgi:hypothetical protein